MITLHNFEEAFHQYSQQKFSLSVLQEQAFLVLQLCTQTPFRINSPIEISQIEIDWLMQQPEAASDYAIHFGGCCYICETRDDLLEVKGCDIEWANTHQNAWPNITDLPMVWDVSTYLQESDGSISWAMFYLAWNNAGGPIYFIPQALWLDARVEEHRQLST